MTNLPDKLPVNPWPLGSDELEAKRLAIKYNSLDVKDTQREVIYKEWEDADSRASWD